MLVVSCEGQVLTDPTQDGFGVLFLLFNFIVVSYFVCRGGDQTGPWTSHTSAIQLSHIPSSWNGLKSKISFLCPLSRDRDRIGSGFPSCFTHQCSRNSTHTVASPCSRGHG
jgi:hypothetical protein